MMGTVYLVGAGCGTADLITIRGLELLRCCDAVIYDDLIDPALLDAVPAGAEKYYMGKRSGKHSAPQEEISDLLIRKACEGKMVVRLKGGDPFVFGRGGEEILALREAGVPCEEVPGISSAIAIPAEAGIPVTHRGMSQSLHIMTAHTARSMADPAGYFAALAKLSGTLVFLMGVSELPNIVRRLTEAGKPLDTPAAVVSGGNVQEGYAIRGTLADIVERAASARAPAVIVIGAVAELELTSTISRPLKGLKIGLTGTAEVTDKLAAALRELGARTFLAERSLVEELPLDFDLRRLCGGGAHWIVFTSGNGVRLFFRHLREQGVDLRGLQACRFAVIGKSTGETLAEHGIIADLCPPVYTSAALGKELLEKTSPEDQIFLFRSKLGSQALYETLREKRTVEDVLLYDLRPYEEAAERVRPLVEDADYLVFSSGSGVELFWRLYGAVPERATCVCIGEVTAKVLEKRYKRPFLTAPEISAEGIVRAICRHRGE